MNIIRSNSGHCLIGLILLAIGIIFLMENILGIELWGRVWLFWPVILILWSLIELLQKKSIFFGLILLAIGIIFLLRNLELYHWSDSIWKFWPIIIIALGFDQLISRSEYILRSSHTAVRNGKKKIITQDDEII